MAFSRSRSDSEGNSIYDRYVDKPGILLDVLDVSEIFVKDLEKHMHISETKPVWLLPSTDPFTCTLYYNVSPFSLEQGQNFAVFICHKKSVLIVSDGTGKLLIIDTISMLIQTVVHISFMGKQMKLHGIQPKITQGKQLVL